MTHTHTKTTVGKGRSVDLIFKEIGSSHDRPAGPWLRNIPLARRLPSLPGMMIMFVSTCYFPWGLNMLNPPSPNHDCSLETSGKPHLFFVMQKVDSGSHPAVDESNEWSTALHLEGATNMRDLRRCRAFVGARSSITRVIAVIAQIREKMGRAVDLSLRSNWFTPWQPEA